MSLPTVHLVILKDLKPALKYILFSSIKDQERKSSACERRSSVKKLHRMWELRVERKDVSGKELPEREFSLSYKYVRLVMSKCQDPEEIKKLHPRFVELKKIHGIEYEKAATGATGPQKLSSSLISITLKCVAASIGEKVPLTKKLPATTTVGKLKILCESFFKIKSIKPKLFIQEESNLQESTVVASKGDIRISLPPEVKDTGLYKRCLVASFKEGKLRSITIRHPEEYSRTNNSEGMELEEDQSQSSMVEPSYRLYTCNSKFDHYLDSFFGSAIATMVSTRDNCPNEVMLERDGIKFFIPIWVEKKARFIRALQEMEKAGEGSKGRTWEVQTQLDVTLKDLNKSCEEEVVILKFEKQSMGQWNKGIGLDGAAQEIDATLEELSNSPAAANIQKELSPEEMEIEIAIDKVGAEGQISIDHHISIVP
uniref:Ubiquitin-like domain-containing protein n=1 Tax=Solanum lycopersicum TaxID=4081 RepID=A0A3Q7IVJ9_SOLLC